MQFNNREISIVPLNPDHSQVKFMELADAYLKLLNKKENLRFLL